MSKESLEEKDTREGGENEVRGSLDAQRALQRSVSGAASTKREQGRSNSDRQVYGAAMTKTEQIRKNKRVNKR